MVVFELPAAYSLGLLTIFIQRVAFKAPNTYSLVWFINFVIPVFKQMFYCKLSSIRLKIIMVCKTIMHIQSTGQCPIPKYNILLKVIGSHLHTKCVFPGALHCGYYNTQGTVAYITCK